jgi:hypothetical protein
MLKRNRSVRPVGHGRGVPMRLLSAVARKYRLMQIIVWTYDSQNRQRALTWGSGEGNAIVAAKMGEHVAKSFSWPDTKFELTKVTRLKERIRECEAALAQIVEGEPNAVELARTAGKFPMEDEPENLGRWIYYPKGKLTR